MFALGRRWGLRAASVLSLFAAPLFVVSPRGAGAATPGPIMVAGIDAEDGGPGGHGPETVYQNIVNGLLSNVSSGGSGILVVGGGKDLSDDVSTFWATIGTAIGQPITFVNGAANISSQSFAGFALIVVSSSEVETPSGGLTDDENAALTAREFGIATHVNGGGGLLVLTQAGLLTPYAFLAGIGAITSDMIMSGPDDDIDVTAAGTAAGLTDELDVCCWHEQYLTFPSFLQPLAFYAGSTEVAAIGGSSVVLPSGLTLAPDTQTVTAGQNCVVTATVLRGGQPIANQSVTFSVTSGPHAGVSATSVTDGSGNAQFSYPTSVLGNDLITASTAVGNDVLADTANCVIVAPLPSTNPVPVVPVTVTPTFAG
ncbi:MAG: hypothetical protein N2037_08645 [Acidimicrobiales bacterium]|nr:hypothetical protein [Acidimicrobiales bacterium]